MSRELEFERPILELNRQIAELRRSAAGGEPSSDADRAELDTQIEVLEARVRSLQQEVFGALTRWQIVLLSRHPDRPYMLDHVNQMCTDFTELHGDRAYADDGALVGGMAHFEGRPIMLLGHQKGRSTKENVYRNFGMARPEGYRKAMRLMSLAERFRMPVVTLIDTPGAYPGIGAEERGQALVIAESLERMAELTVPVVAIVTGEGGSGGALAIGVGNRVLMFEHATYSVISPEGCASILFKDAAHAERAADALRLTARDLTALKIVDEVIDEPPGGAHRDPAQSSASLADALRRHLTELSAMSGVELKADRYDRFRRLGQMVTLGQEGQA